MTKGDQLDRRTDAVELRVPTAWRLRHLRSRFWIGTFTVPSEAAPGRRSRGGLLHVGEPTVRRPVSKTGGMQVRILSPMRSPLTSGGLVRIDNSTVENAKLGTLPFPARRRPSLKVRLTSTISRLLLCERRHGPVVIMASRLFCTQEFRVRIPVGPRQGIALGRWTRAPRGETRNGMKGMWCPACLGSRRHAVRVRASRRSSHEATGRRHGPLAHVVEHRASA